jgi:hypothetical protein
LFAPVDGFHRISKRKASPSLYLNECDCSISLDYQIDVAVTVPESTLNDAPSLSLEPPLRDPLSQLAELLPGR